MSTPTFKIKAVSYAPDDVKMYVKWPFFMSTYTREKIWREVVQEFIEDPYVPVYMSRTQTREYPIAVAEAHDADEVACDVLETVKATHARVLLANEDRKDAKKKARYARKHPVVYTDKDC